MQHAKEKFQMALALQLEQDQFCPLDFSHQLTGSVDLTTKRQTFEMSRLHVDRVNQSGLMILHSKQHESSHV